MGTFLTISKLGLRAQEEGKFALAFNLLGSALENPGLRLKSRIRMEIRRAECLLSCGNLTACLELLTRISAAHPESADFFLEAGLFLARLDEFEKALHFLRKAQRLEPRMLRIYDALARMYAEINRYPEAIAILQKGLRIPNPILSNGIGIAFLHVQLALCYFYTERMQAARRHFRFAEKLDDTKILDWDIYGRCLLVLGEYQKALDCFDRGLLENAAGDYEVYLFKAKALMCLKQPTDAMELISQAKKEIGELLIFPSDLKYFAPLVANGFLNDLGAILVEE